MEKNKSKKLTVVALVAFAILIVGASYAYLTEQTVTGGKMTDINVTSYTTDVLTFTTGDAINLEADQTTFGKDKGSVSGATYARALLTANNKTNNAVEHYNLYLNIENNTFTYSVQDNKPELIMTITDKEGNEVKNIDGLTYTEVTDRTNKKVSGYDITTKSGLVTIFNNREIIAEPKAEDKWNITITFVNYEENQNANTGKVLSAKLMIQKEEISITNVCKNGRSLSSCITAIDGIDETLYHHDASLTNGAGDNSYRFAGASDQVNNYVCFGSNESPCPTDNLYRIIGVFGDKVKLIKSDYATSTLLGADGDYKQAYTATGYGTSKYKGNNLANIAVYTWNYKNNTTINSGNGSNTWSTSLLNKTNLNKNFITNIGADWATKIDTTTWKVGGNMLYNIANQPAKTAYQNEIVSPVTTNTTDNATDYSAKVGLMYASDYGFAAAPSAWTSNLYNYDDKAIINVNWMYMGLGEWTITRLAFNAREIFTVSMSGYALTYVANYAYGVRPVFYLTSSVNYASGSGSATDPIIITD